MAEWQNGPLAGIDEIAYVVAMHEDARGDEPDPADLDRWTQQFGFTADALLLDEGRHVIDAYIRGNPGPKYTEAVTVIIDKQMRIRRVGSTYDTGHDVNLQLLLELAAE